MHGKRAWHKLYTSARWSNPIYGLRWQCLVRDGFICQACGRSDHSRRLHAQHRIPHKGDPALFFNLANLRTLCPPCHQQITTEEERGKARGYTDLCDKDGYPLDERHPFNQIRSA
jgi:5-methylcytosine-specific restriction protein A